MTISSAISRGLRQAVSGPKAILLLWLVNVLVAVPLTLQLRASLEDSFGTSLVADAMRDGFDTGWHGEFEAGAQGFETTFTPSITGPAAVLDHLDAWLSGGLFELPPALVALGVAYALAWAFLLGGILDRWARPVGGGGPERFFAACGRFFPRFAALALLAGVVYFSIYLFGRWLYPLIEDAARDVTEEKTVMAWMLAGALLCAALLHATRMLFAYAKIAVVVEGNRGALSCLGLAGRTVGRDPLRTLGVNPGFGLLTALLLALYATAAPGVGQSTLPTVVLAFLFSQLYLVARLTLRLGLLGGQMHLYRALARDTGADDLHPGG